MLLSCFIKSRGLIYILLNISTATFKLDSQISLVCTSSKLTVECQMKLRPKLVYLFFYGLIMLIYDVVYY